MWVLQIVVTYYLFLYGVGDNKYTFYAGIVFLVVPLTHLYALTDIPEHEIDAKVLYAYWIFISLKIAYHILNFLFLIGEGIKESILWIKELADKYLTD